MPLPDASAPEPPLKLISYRDKTERSPWHPHNASKTISTTVKYTSPFGPEER
jgi:hypothetical protein